MSLSSLSISYILFRSSPEVITDGMFSKASDVWAFAVLIWEIFTLIDKDLDESDEEISHLPYHQLTSKELVHLLLYLLCNTWHTLIRWSDNLLKEQILSESFTETFNTSSQRCSTSGGVYTSKWICERRNHLQWRGKHQKIGGYRFLGHFWKWKGNLKHFSQNFWWEEGIFPSYHISYLI
jgi:hypothetical protein